MAHEAAKAAATGSKPLSELLQTALRHVRDAGLATSAGLDTAQTARSFVAVLNASTKQASTARATFSQWKNRVARGLLVDGFGERASLLRQSLLQDYDHDTLEAAGLPHVAPRRKEMRLQLQQFIDSSIQQLYSGQVANLENRCLKRFNAELLATVNRNDSVESVMDTNAAAMRKQALLFETVVDDLSVPELGLMTEKAARDLTPKLNDALAAFPDSPAAQIKRTRKVANVVSQSRKKPGKRSMDIGLDLVAMLRPDGYGSLQGYAMYALPGGHSLTFGVQNDADDPAVLAQFGGVRPPLLRVQPKLRFDVEL